MKIWRLPHIFTCMDVRVYIHKVILKKRFAIFLTFTVCNLPLLFPQLFLYGKCCAFNDNYTIMDVAFKKACILI